MHCGHGRLWYDVLPESITKPPARRTGGTRAAQVDFPLALMNFTSRS